MGIEVDSLEIPLKTHSQTAIRSIDTLIDRLGVLNTSLTKINGSGLTGVANGVNKLSNAMQGMKSVGTADFTRLATNITKISSLDSKAIQRSASAIGQISKSLGALKTVSVSGTSKQVAELASGISKLGYKSSTKAIENIPKLATAMRDLMSSLSKAPKVSQNIIDMTNALAKLARTGASSGKAATSLSRSLDTYTKSTGKASSGTKGLASALGKMYASYWLLFRAFQKIGQSITLASDLVEVQNVVNTVFGDMTAKVEQYADKSIEQFGMSELAFKQYASRFQAMGSAMGIDSGLIGQANSFLNKSTNGYVALSDSMADVSLTLTQLTADMASFYNVEQSAVAEDLAAIFTGETRPLRTYGLDLTQATLSEWAMKQGLDADIQSMSQAEKTMLRYQYVLANTTAAQGDFARTANTWANQLRILQEQLKKWASVVGTGFIAAFKPFLQTLNAVMAKVIDFTENVLNALGNIFGWKFEISGGGITDDLADSMGDTAIDTGDAAGSAGDLSDNLGDAAANAKKLYSTVLGIDELNINNPNTGSTGSGSGGSGGTGGSGSGGAGTGTGTGLNTTISRNDAILKAYESSIDSLYELGEYIGDTLTKTLNSIDWDSVYQGARDFGKGLADFLNGLISPELFGAVGRTIAGALNTAIYAALSFGETFDFADFGLSIATGINEFFRTFDFKALAKTLNTWVNGIEETIITAVSHINWGRILSSIVDFASALELDTAVLVGWYAIPKIFKAITSSKIIRGLQNIVNIFKSNGGLAGGIKAIRSSLTKLQKGVLTTVTVFLEFSLVKDAFYDIASGAGNVVEAIAQIGISAGTSAALLYAAFGPVGIAIAGITALIGAVAGLISAFDEQERKLAEQKQIELYGDTIENVTKATNDAADATRNRMEAAREYVETAGLAEATMAKNLADKYFNLAEKESLTNDQKLEMQNLAKALIGTYPKLEEYYNAETGLLDTTRQTVDQLIESRLKEIKLAAVEEKLKEAYKEQSDALENLQGAIEDASTAQSTMNDLQDKYQALVDKKEALTRYEEIGRQLENATGDTTDLIEEQQRLADFLTNGGTESFPTFTTLENDIFEAQQNINDFQGTYDGFMDALSNSTIAYEDVQGNIDKFTQMLTDGMKSAAGDGVEGAAEGIDEGKDALSTANKLLAEAGLEGYAEGQDSHSPSKKYMKLAGDAVSGLMLGFNTSVPVFLTYMQGIATKIANSFGNSLTKTLKKVAQNIPTYFSTAWVGITTVFSVAPAYFSLTFTSAYSMVKLAFQPMNTWFHKKWDDTKAVFKDVKSFFKSAFDSAYQAITSAFSGISVFFRRVANNIVNPIESAVNGAIKGMNWILDEVGSSKNLSFWTAPNFATGSNGVPQDTIGVVNDQPGAIYKELIVPPSGKPFIPEGRNVMLPLEKGTKIMPAKQTKAFMSGMPHFAGGIGDFFGKSWKSASSYTGSVLDYMQKPKELLQIAADKFTSTAIWDGVFGTMAAYTSKTLVDNSVEFVKSLFDKMMTVNYNPSAGVEQWRNLAAKALQMTKQYSAANLNLLLYQMQTESGGNPNAINNWDINAKNGTPSKGLMQVIDPTFKAYAYPGYDKNIYDPLSNMLAAIRYTLSRYGSLANGWKGHGYASGIGKINLSDLIPAYEVGGFPEDGLFFANHNELVGQFDNGRTVVANNTNIQSGIKEGVKEAVAEILAPYLQQIADNTRETADKDFSFDVDGRSLVSAYDRRKNRNGFSFT